MKTEAEIRRVRNIWFKSQQLIEQRFGRIPIARFDTEIAALDYILGDSPNQALTESLTESLDELEAVLNERGIYV